MPEPGWIWVVCVALTLLDLSSVLVFAYPVMGSCIHCAVWVLSFAAARRFPSLKWLPAVLWGSTLLLAVASWMLVYVGGIGLLPLTWGAYFFIGPNKHQPFVYQPVYVFHQSWYGLHANWHQEGIYGGIGQGNRRVVLLSVTPLFRLVLPPDWFSPFKGGGWRPVNKKYGYLTADSTRLLRRDHCQREEALCRQAGRRQDSLDRQRRLPPPVSVLPLATQRGAGTLGFIGPEDRVWRNLGQCFVYDECRCGDCPVLGIWYLEWGKPVTITLQAHRKAGRLNQRFVLVLKGVTGPGVWPAALTLSDSENRRYWRSGPDSLGIRITRLDTAARIISGVFAGPLYAYDPFALVPTAPDSTHPVHFGQGRFDVRYHRIKHR